MAASNSEPKSIKDEHLCESSIHTSVNRRFKRYLRRLFTYNLNIVGNYRLSTSN